MNINVYINKKLINNTELNITKKRKDLIMNAYLNSLSLMASF
jgi:hypothetical protein